MMYIENANLPENASLVLLGEEYGYLSTELEALGISSITVPQNPYIDKRLASHADLSVFFAGSNKLYLAPHLRNTNFSKLIEELGFETVYLEISQSAEYPNDCQFNVCIWNRNILYNEHTAERRIISDFISQKEILQLKCKQGYCKCMVSVVDSNSIITSDHGIAKVCEEQGIDVLKIEPGHIDLDGFDYGFIGGASFKSSKNTMIFTGSLDMHPDKDAILNFLSKRNIMPKYLTNKKIFDVGSIFPIIEKNNAD